MSNNSFEDKYFNSILNQVLVDIEEEDIKKSEEIYDKFNDMPALNTSLHHKLRMKKLILSHNKETNRNQSIQIKRIAVTVAIAIIFIFSTELVTNADIYKIFQWLGFYHEEYIDLSLSKSYTQRILEETASWKLGKIYVPSVIPDGYELGEIQVLNNSITMNYVNANDEYLRYNMASAGNGSLISTDNKDSSSKKFKINGYDAIYVENNSVRIIHYNTNEYFFSVESDRLGEIELIKIAENIENLENIVAN